jgi:hypothetical protein
MSTCSHCGIERVHITLFFQCTETKQHSNKQKIYQDIPKYTKTKQHFKKQKIYQDIPKYTKNKPA